MLQTSVQGQAVPGDTIVVSEKAAVLVTGRGVPITSVRPGALARLLAAKVRPRPGSRGLSVPEKMQYVLERSGRTRLLLASAASAVTRPLGVHGLFYRIAGPLARDLDGVARRSSTCSSRRCSLGMLAGCARDVPIRRTRAVRGE